MLALGIPDKYAMQRMGHATSNMLKTVYQHTFTQREIEVANLVNARMEATMQHEMQHEPKEAQ
jgi:integrase